MIELTETTYVKHVWFVAWEQTDWMAVLYRAGPGRPWEAKYRFRYYADTPTKPSDPFLGEDRKSFYAMDFKDDKRDVDVIVRGLDTVASTLATQAHGKLVSLPIDGGAEKFMRLLRRQPWAHVKVTLPEPKEPQ